MSLQIKWLSFTPRAPEISTSKFSGVPITMVTVWKFYLQNISPLIKWLFSLLEVQKSQPVSFQGCWLQWHRIQRCIMCHSSEKNIFLHKNWHSLLFRGLIMPSDDVYMYLFGFQGDRSVNVHFYSKPRHVTPQIDCLRKMSPVLRVSTHIYGVSKKIDGKMFIFRVNLGMWPLKLIVLEKQALFWGFQHTFMGFPRR